MKTPKYRCMLTVCIISLLLAACSGENAVSTLERTTESVGNETAESVGEQAAEPIGQAASESVGEQTAKSVGDETSPMNVQDEPYSPQLCSDIAESLVYTGDPVVMINDNIPFFSQADYTTEAFEAYSDLDALGRCATAYANVGIEIMPTEERGAIGSVKPTGWHTVKYNDIVEGNYLYNRCHLIAYELAGENANEKNLITGTRYMNVQGMLPFENMVAEYVKSTENHVLYRVTPIFEDENLVASGVVMEAFSVEDYGQGICFNIYAFNVQPGIEIDYATGESRIEGNQTGQAKETAAAEATQPQQTEYILNTNTHKFHYAFCSGVDDMKEKNKQTYTGSREDVINMGYMPCKRCNP